MGKDVLLFRPEELVNIDGHYLYASKYWVSYVYNWVETSDEKVDAIEMEIVFDGRLSYGFQDIYDMILTKLRELKPNCNVIKVLNFQSM